MKKLVLGEKVAAPEVYDPGLLCPIPRPERIAGMHGFDLWRAYEFMWLDEKGRPRMNIAEICYPAMSENLIESKSMKLYLYSLARRPFARPEDVAELIRRDLDNVLNTPWISVRLHPLNAPHPWAPAVNGTCVDDLDVEVSGYTPDASLLEAGTEESSEMLWSDLLHSYCPITHQPDYGSVMVDYAGNRIRPEGLLRYVISFRDHEGFAEACCERIYADLLERCAPGRLEVTCCYTRRGGIDITPVRSTTEITPENHPLWRLSRQ